MCSNTANKSAGVYGYVWMGRISYCMCGISVCGRKFVCLHLRVFESVIVILSTCSHVLSVLFIITTTAVRLTRGTFSLFLLRLATSVTPFFPNIKDEQSSRLFIPHGHLRSLDWLPNKMEIMSCPLCVSSCDLIV